MLEGVAFGLRDSLDLMRGVGVPDPAAVRVTGGGSRSPLWRQILADAMETAVETTSTSEGAAQGAALLAAVAIGAFSTVEDACTRLVEIDERVEPSADLGAVRAQRDRYVELYTALSPTFHATGEGTR